MPIPVYVEWRRFGQKYSMVEGLLMWLRHLLGVEIASLELPRSVIDWTRLITARAGVRCCIR
jgi:hypothetical protein